MAKKGECQTKGGNDKQSNYARPLAELGGGG
jgi:hypothetical protein